MFDVWEDRDCFVGSDWNVCDAVVRRQWALHIVFNFEWNIWLWSLYHAFLYRKQTHRLIIFLHSKCRRLINFKVYYLLLLVCLSLDRI